MTAPDGVRVDTAEIRAHANHIAALNARFDAVKTASAHIANDASAYGVLCGWIAAILEGRHTRQDELVAYVSENLQMVVEQLNTVAANYDAMEAGTAGMIKKYNPGLSG